MFTICLIATLLLPRSIGFFGFFSSFSVVGVDFSDFKACLDSCERIFNFKGNGQVSESIKMSIRGPQQNDVTNKLSIG